jgi:hypothetical protein
MSLRNAHYTMTPLPSLLFFCESRFIENNYYYSRVAPHCPLSLYLASLSVSHSLGLSLWLRGSGLARARRPSVVL